MPGPPLAAPSASLTLPPRDVSRDVSAPGSLAGSLADTAAPPTARSTLHQALLALEQQLLTPATRQSSAAVAALLADEFREVGKSGRIYSKAEILTQLAQEAPQALRIEAFTAALLGPEAALVMYESVSEAGTRAHRSSVWVYRQGRWQMLYHQGTMAAEVGEGTQR